MSDISHTTALLIGIDRYSQKPLDDGTYFPNLGGCVRDIELVESTLRDRFRLTDDNIIKLASRRESAGSPEIVNGSEPTYENLVAAFKAIIETRNKGDQIYIHYSGHGGRSRTIFPELKGESGLDESIVPCDVGENGPCFLRDVEIAYLLQAMSDKGLVVSMVLDSCHSGGATRAFLGTPVRGINGIYSGTLIPESSVASRDALAQVFEKVGKTRNVAFLSGWQLPTPKDFVLLAACQADEVANEYAFEVTHRNGALTYWMLDGLRQMKGRCSFRMIHRHALTRVHNQFRDQTPQLEGDGDRDFLGLRSLPALPTILVTQINAEEGLVTVNAGKLQGVGPEMLFALFAPDEISLIPKNRKAIVKTIEVDGVSSKARLISNEESPILTEGMQAVLLGLPSQLKGKIFLAGSDSLPAGKEAIQKVNDALLHSDEIDGDRKWLEIVNSLTDADLQLDVSTAKEFAITDAGGTVVQNLRPAIGIDDDQAVETVIGRLAHLTRYRNVQRIENIDPGSPLSKKLVAKLGFLTKKNGEEVFTPAAPNRRILSDGQEFCVRIENRSDERVNFAIINLRPDWGIVQVHPPTRDTDILEPNSHFDLRARAKLGSNPRESIEWLKVFGCNDETSFRWLELPSLDQPRRQNDGVRSEGTTLGQLMSAFTAESPTRDVVSLISENEQLWTTAEVELCIRRPTIAHVEDPALSLLQSAFDEAIAAKGDSTRNYRGSPTVVRRPASQNALIREIAQYCVALDRGGITDEELVMRDEDALENAQARGLLDVPKYCSGLAVGLAREWFKAKIWQDDEKYVAYKEGLSEKFGSCDPMYVTAMTQFIEFLRSSGHVDYQKYVRLDDFVIDQRLSDDAVIGVVADWATGEPEALEVLTQVKSHSPSIAAHLGDIYYAGTESEVENYFYKPWTEILGPDILSFALPGNHDYYSGGKAFFAMLDRLADFNKLGQKPASYFCLRNEHWQIIGLDTALNDRLIGPTTRLQDSELKWLEHKIETREDRRTILMSHHQLFSTNDQFDGKSFNPALHKQVKEILPFVDLWLWGHEHDLVVFDPFMGLERGRCIGGSAYPVGNFEMPATQKNLGIPFNKSVALSKGRSFYHHCYAILRLNNGLATVEYYEDRNGGTKLWEERI